MKAYAVEEFGGGEIKYFTSEDHAEKFIAEQDLKNGKWTWVRYEEGDIR